MAVDHSLGSDHYGVLYCLSFPKPAKLRKEIKCRKLHTINPQAFLGDIMTSPLVLQPKVSLDDLSAQYNQVLTKLLDKHAPLKTCVITIRPYTPWYDEEIQEAKTERRKYERIWRKSKLEVFKQIYRGKCRDVNSRNKLKLNDTKTEVQYITSKRKVGCVQELRVGDVSLQPVSSDPTPYGVLHPSLVKLQQTKCGKDRGHTKESHLLYTE